MENLLIVESPAKCKTIKKYLGKKYEVMASYGHIADLAKKNMGIDIENDFQPKYIVSPEKKKVVNQLKKAAKKAKEVWIATDEDREGEAIGRHVSKQLGLDINKTKRIVFNEITKQALEESIKKPRTLDINLINAQQARRILDRLVGFELSPVLRKKIKSGLSAGRVQSVAVRLIVDREREIQAFDSKSFFKITGFFHDSEKNKIVANYKKKIRQKQKVHDIFNEIKSKTPLVDSIEKKDGKKPPPAPFTTSTLQQEASKTLGFSVSQTMRVAQKLYEAGHITYMRTDSVNMSATARTAAKDFITNTFGKEYSKTRVFKTKSKSAQEAHECIRPTDLSEETKGSNVQEKKLYSLIRKRALASQMAEAKIEKTKLTIVIKETKHEFIAEGEVIKFEGFLKIYENKSDSMTKLLPPLKENDKLTLSQAEAIENFDRHPARYTEASLVKKLETEGIGRPSTYAPTIGTIQKRGYVILESREGIEKQVTNIILKEEHIEEKTTKKNVGAEKKKLFPTDMGMMVTDFLNKHFPKIIDYSFTANVEQKFDDIAQGNEKRVDMLSKFYKPFHKLIVTVDETAERQKKEKTLGKDPKDGKTIIARMGRYGPLVQKGNNEDENKQFASIKSPLSIDTISLEQAIELLKFPKEIAKYKNKKMIINIGRFGPYIKRDKIFISIPKDLQENLHDINEKTAVELIKAKQKKDKEKTIHTRHHENQNITVENGRRGPFIRTAKKNYKLPKERKEKPQELTLETCLEIIKNQK